MLMCPRCRALLQSVYEKYALERLNLLTPCVSAFFGSLGSDMDLLNLLRLGCNYILHMCSMEYQLFLKLFGESSASSPFLMPPVEDDGGQFDFQTMVFELASELYSSVRVLMIHELDLETLCEAIQILQTEIIEDQIRSRGEEMASLEPVIDRIVQDTQERLVFSAQIFIRDNIVGFEPSKEDLDYPAKLQIESAQTNMYVAWYPVVERTLTCLSKIYRFVDIRIFEELAQDVLQTCTACVKMASAEITAKSSEMDGQLFLLKNLLTLREQITPFEIGFSIQEATLDFSVTTGKISCLHGSLTVPQMH